jgi:hypothetical protein
MDTFIEFIQKKGKYILLGIVVLFVLYILLQRSHQFITFPAYLFLRKALAWTIAILSLASFPIAIISDLHWLLKTLYIILMIPLYCLSIFFFSAESFEILDSDILNGRNYHLVYWYENYDDAFACELYECNEKGTDCSAIESSVHYDCYNLGRDPQLKIDPVHNEIHVQYANSVGHEYLSYSYGDLPRKYAYQNAPSEDDNYFYYIAADAYIPYSQNSRNVMLYQCEKDHSACSRLPFQLPVKSSYRNLSLEREETSGELNIMGIDYQTEEKILLYTYGKEPTCWVDECSLID